MTEPLSAHEEELLRAYNRTLADSYSRWKEEGENLPKTVARMLFQWRAALEGADSPEPRTVEEAATVTTPLTASVTTARRAVSGTPAPSGVHATDAPPLCPDSPDSPGFTESPDSAVFSNAADSPGTALSSAPSGLSRGGALTAAATRKGKKTGTASRAEHHGETLAHDDAAATTARKSPAPPASGGVNSASLGAFGQPASASAATSPTAAPAKPFTENAVKAQDADITKESSSAAAATMPQSSAQLAPGLPGKSPVLRESPRKPKAEKSAGAEQGQLPGIPVPRTPGETAPMSNYLARTSLFAPIRKGRRVMHDKQKLHSPEGIEAFYTGKQLDMADQDVYLTALRLAGGIKAGDRILINRAAFLRMLGYKHNPGARDYKWLEESFYRIATGRVIIKAKHIEANLPLMGALLTDTRSGDYYFTIPRETYALWAKNLYSYIDLVKRHALERNVPLSKWLQSYAQSHAPGTHTISMDLLHLWCGYGGRLRDFRDSLTGALDELTRVGILASWSVQERGKGRQKKIMISWVRERTHRDDAPAPALNDEQ